MDKPPEQELIDIEAALDEIRRRVREEFHAQSNGMSAQADLEYVADNCLLGRERAISTRRRWSGRFLVWIRKILYAETCRTIDPALQKQSRWNRKAAYVLQRQEAEIARLREQIEAIAARGNEAAPPSAAAPTGPEAPQS